LPVSTSEPTPVTRGALDLHQRFACVRRVCSLEHGLII
jgi:hypothetical protein